jgi:PilZ domain
MDEESQRRTPRYPFVASAEVIVENTGHRINAHVKELSLHGCYLDASTPLSAKTAILLKIFTRQDYFEAPATVIYSNPTLGMGIAFRSITLGCQAVLQKWLLEAMKEDPEPRFEEMQTDTKGVTGSQGEYVRIGQRINLRVAVALEWIKDGRSLRVEGHTGDVSSYGCLVIVPESLEVGQDVRLINLVSHKDCEATVVRQGQNSPAGWELGLHLKNPLHEFWELNF